MLAQMTSANHAGIAFSVSCAAWAAFAVGSADVHDCRVPMHYGLTGEPDGWFPGGCGALWILPVLVLILACLPVAMRRCRWKLNHPVFMGNPNVDGPVRDFALLYLDAMIATACLLLAVIAQQSPRIATHGGSIQPWQTIPALLALMAALTVGYLARGRALASEQ
jgi:hypothetical protein